VWPTAAAAFAAGGTLDFDEVPRLARIMLGVPPGTMVLKASTWLPASRVVHFVAQTAIIFVNSCNYDAGSHLQRSSLLATPRCGSRQYNPVPTLVALDRAQMEAAASDEAFLAQLKGAPNSR
jgi:hypothetical protein